MCIYSTCLHTHPPLFYTKSSYHRLYITPHSTFTPRVTRDCALSLVPHRFAVTAPHCPHRSTIYRPWNRMPIEWRLKWSWPPREYATKGRKRNIFDTCHGSTHKQEWYHEQYNRDRQQSPIFHSRTLTSFNIVDKCTLYDSWWISTHNWEIHANADDHIVDKSSLSVPTLSCLYPSDSLSTAHR